MTEAGPVLSMCPGFAKEPLPTKAGSCGIVVRNAEMKIVDPDTGASVGYNEPGEICIRGEQIMKGTNTCVKNMCVTTIFRCMILLVCKVNKLFCTNNMKILGEVMLIHYTLLACSIEHGP